MHAVSTNQIADISHFNDNNMKHTSNDQEQPFICVLLRSCSEKFSKTPRKTFVTEYSFSKNKRMQPANLQQTAQQLFLYQLKTLATSK